MKSESKVLISIVIPVYNVEEFIHQSVSSVLEQTYTDIEVILVDDGSNDKSGEICDEYAAFDNRVHVIHKKNQGLVSARRYGVNYSKGEYIIFVDSDDWIEPDMIELLVKKAIESNADIVTSGFIQFGNGEDLVVKDRISSGFYSNKKSLEGMIYPKMICWDNDCHAGITVATWDKLFRAELIKKHADRISYDIAWGTDFVLTFPCILDAESIYITDICKYHYRVNEKSLTIHSDSNYVFHMNALFKGINTLIEEGQGGKILDQTLQSKIMFILHRGVNNAYRLGGNRFEHWRYLYVYNKEIYRNALMRQTLLKAQKRKDLFTDRDHKIIDFLAEGHCFIAFLYELFT